MAIRRPKVGAGSVIYVLTPCNSPNFSRRGPLSLPTVKPVTRATLAKQPSVLTKCTQEVLYKSHQKDFSP